MLRCCRLECLLGGGIFLAAALAGTGATRPNYEASWAFGFELQQDFAKRHSAAIIDRLDEAALRQKVFSAYPAETANSLDATKTWKEALFPKFVDGLKSRDSCLQLSFGRVLNLNGNRTLEFVLVNRDGSIDQIYWDVAEGADGQIRITDQRVASEYLSYTKRTRDLMILNAGIPTVHVDDDERGLEQASAKHHSRVGKTLSLMRDDKLDEAFALWSEMPDEVKESAIWRDLRMTMAMRGGAAAVASVQDDIQERRPGVEPLLLYKAAMRRGDFEAALRAIDDVLVKTYDSPVYRAMRCDLLTKMNRPKYSLTAATELYRLNPYMFAGYVQAVRAAMVMEDFPAAVGVLRAWTEIYAPAMIDAFLKAQLGFEKLRNSPAYQDWLRTAAPVTVP